MKSLITIFLLMVFCGFVIGCESVHDSSSSDGAVVGEHSAVPLVPEPLPVEEEPLQPIIQGRSIDVYNPHFPMALPSVSMGSAPSESTEEGIVSGDTSVTIYPFGGAHESFLPSVSTRPVNRAQDYGIPIPKVMTSDKQQIFFQHGSSW